MSGMRPTGGLHLGHLVGVLTQWANFCETADAFFEIADLHAYTTEFDDPQKIRDARNEMVAVWLAAGVDPQKSTIFLAVGGSGNRRAPRAAFDDHAGVVARARADVQRPNRRARAGNRDVRFSRLSAAAVLRHRDRARRVRAGRARSSRASRVRARSRAPLQPPLRRRARRARRAAGDALRISPKCRAPTGAR